MSCVCTVNRVVFGCGIPIVLGQIFFLQMGTNNVRTSCFVTQGDDEVNRNASAQVYAYLSIP